MDALSHNGRLDLADLGGAVHEVEPLGPIEPDGDYVGNPGILWQTIEALVVRVVDDRLMPLDEIRQILGPLALGRTRNRLGYHKRFGRCWF
jgi:hypothetical protein